MTATGQWAAPYHNAQVAPPSQPSEYYVAHLALLADAPGPSQVTPFTLVSIDLCQLPELWRLLLTSPPSLHGYTSNIHRYNYSAAVMVRFSHFLLPCYAQNFNQEYADVFNKYLVRTAYIAPKVPLSLLERLAGQSVPPIVIAATRKCRLRAQELGLPCWSVRDMTPAELNREIGARFREPARTLTAEEREALRDGTLRHGIEPNIFVSTYPDEHQFEESQLYSYPTSRLRLLLPNELLSNALRRRHLPADGPTQPDHAHNIDRLLAATHTVFGQKITDYLLHDAQYGRNDPTLAAELRNRLDEYITTQSPENYEALVHTAQEHRNEYPGACDYLLCCPALNKHTSAIFRRTIPDRILNLVYQARRNDYLATTRAAIVRSPQDAEQLQVLMQFQGLENEYLSTVLGLYALSYRQPVLRTPQLAAGLFGKLRQLRATYEGGNTRAFTRNLERFTTTLQEALPAPIQEFLRTTPARSIKLISDLPLEWLSVDGVPLLFQRTVSRMPITPGNGLFAHFNHCGADLRIGPEEIQRVLILNCLSPDDQLFGAAEHFSAVLRSIGVRHSYESPATTEAYAQALRDHQPYFLVHWGHGSYDRNRDRGYLHIRNEQTELWNLQGASIPPIVMLAACETAAIAETHNTPANAWLALGARSVLATYFPVRADLTTILFTRIFANLTEAVHGQQVLTSWSTVVSKTIALNRYLDYYYGFVEWCTRRGRPLPPPEVLFEYTYRWNHGPGDMAAGYHGCTELLRDALHHFGAAFSKDFQEYLAIGTTVPHTMFFVHLGAPETLRIRKEQDPDFKADSPSLAYWRAREAQER
jgi:hypothetical protein